MDESIVMLKCKTCLGEYETDLQDGTKYYHHCALIEETDGKLTKRQDARNENVGKKEEGKGVEIIAIEEII